MRDRSLRNPPVGPSTAGIIAGLPRAPRRAPDHTESDLGLHPRLACPVPAPYLAACPAPCDHHNEIEPRRPPRRRGALGVHSPAGEPNLHVVEPSVARCLVERRAARRLVERRAARHSLAPAALRPAPRRARLHRLPVARDRLRARRPNLRVRSIRRRPGTCVCGSHQTGGRGRDQVLPGERRRGRGCGKATAPPNKGWWKLAPDADEPATVSLSGRRPWWGPATVLHLTTDTTAALAAVPSLRVDAALFGEGLPLRDADGNEAVLHLCARGSRPRPPARGCLHPSRTPRPGPIAPSGPGRSTSTATPTP